MKYKRKTRVLTSYYRPKPGGYCTRLFRGIEALLEAGHEVHYLSVSPFPIDHPDCHFHRFPWPKNHTDILLFWAVFHFFAPIQMLYIGFRYHITHAFAFGTNYGYALQPLRVLKKIPTTLFLRADTVNIHRINGKNLLLIGLETIIEGLSIQGTTVYGVSDSLIKNVLIRHRYTKPKRTGVLRNDIKPFLHTKYRTPSIPLHMGCVGILEIRKNQSLLIEVMKNIPASDAHLHLYGIGPQETELRKYSYSKNVQNKVIFHGWVESSTIWNQVDLLVFPSLHEGSPNAVLEALANKIPLLASNIPEHAEILPKTCLYSPIDDKAWTNAIRSLLSSPCHSLLLLREEQSKFTKELIFNWNARFVESVIG